MTYKIHFIKTVYTNKDCKLNQLNNALKNNMTEYIIMIASGLILFLDDYFKFLPKSLTYIILAAAIIALLHIIVKESVAAAIKESKE